MSLRVDGYRPFGFAGDIPCVVTLLAVSYGVMRSPELGYYNNHVFRLDHIRRIVVENKKFETHNSYY